MRDQITSKLNEVNLKEQIMSEREKKINLAYDGLSNSEKEMFKNLEEEFSKRKVQDMSEFDMDSINSGYSKEIEIKELNFDNFIKELQLSLASFKNENQLSFSMDNVARLKNKNLNITGSKFKSIELNEIKKLKEKEIVKEIEEEIEVEMNAKMDLEKELKIDLEESLKLEAENLKLIDKANNINNQIENNKIEIKSKAKAREKSKNKDIKNNSSQNEETIKIDITNSITSSHNIPINEMIHKGMIKLDNISQIHEMEILNNKDQLLTDNINITLSNYNLKQFRDSRPFKTQIREKRLNFAKSLNEDCESYIKTELTHVDTSRFLNSGLVLEGVRTNKAFYLIRNKRMEQSINNSSNEVKFEDLSSKFGVKSKRSNEVDISVSSNRLSNPRNSPMRHNSSDLFLNKSNKQEDNISIKNKLLVSIIQEQGRDKNSPKKRRIGENKSNSRSSNANTSVVISLEQDNSGSVTSRKSSINSKYAHIQSKYNKVNMSINTDRGTESTVKKVSNVTNKSPILKKSSINSARPTVQTSIGSPSIIITKEEINNKYNVRKSMEAKPNSMRLYTLNSKK